MPKDARIVPIHSSWLNIPVPIEYEDKDLMEIISFFVIHSPCDGQSAKQISLTDRGWKPKPWYSPKYLKDKLDKAIWEGKPRMLKMCESKSILHAELNSFDLDNDFYTSRDTQRAAYVRINAPNCSSEYMSLFYHIRNSLAHGRITMFPAANNDITFVMEDGAKDKNDFEVSARIIINKSSLVRIIDLLKTPPIENDYTEDILNAIRNGKRTKEKIVEELGIDDYTYKKFIQALKLNKRIAHCRNQWTIIENAMDS